MITWQSPVIVTLLALLGLNASGPAPEAPTPAPAPHSVSAPLPTPGKGAAGSSVAPDTLARFFARWNQSVKQNPPGFIAKNDTIKAVFDAFRAFYKPLNLAKLGDWEWGNQLNASCRYVVVQNQLSYAVLPTDKFDSFDWQKSRKHSITNFRPPVNLDARKVLYLSTPYAKLLTQFLGAAATKVGAKNMMAPSQPTGQSERRYQLLRPYIPLLHGHWGGYWHLETHPEASYILLNEQLTVAKIDFRVGYQGGEATLVKSGNTWVIKKSEATWIE